MKGKMYKLTGTGLFGKTRKNGMGTSSQHFPKSKRKNAIPNTKRDVFQTEFTDKQLPLILPGLPVKDT
ncbi:hypothetical protein GCM10011499_13460 [Pelagibacterium lentulum]|uniref:Uncharacterized protein n=1 Tax=Pelagibacterium lentulum TaxID=2029865 RepID=A0A916VW29_9HYPH|nr:hypothetical protein GCM10011499_13460 [Pelagibacterium lentulum]